MDKTAVRILLVILAFILIGTVYSAFRNLNKDITNTIRPLQEANSDLSTQIAGFLHPTPTVLPDPVTIVHEVRSLARLETIQYSVEKIIT
ncbi:MAG: hypothetical protein ABIL11_16615, partial [Chloroflexota bacterium]